MGVVIAGGAGWVMGSIHVGEWIGGVAGAHQNHRVPFRVSSGLVLHLPALGAWPQPGAGPPPRCLCHHSRGQPMSKIRGPVDQHYGFTCCCVVNV